MPFPLAAWRFLMSFFTLKISICWSVSSLDDMVAICSGSLLDSMQ